jgi:hypothetical protein
MTTPGCAIGSSGSLEAYRADSTRLLAGQILFEPLDVLVAVDDGGLADQRTEQWQG